MSRRPSREGFKRDYVSESGWPGGSTAFIHPEPLDPNDRVRQKSQARSDSYPYDRPVSYGAPVGTDTGGAAYQRPSDTTPPRPRNRKASDAIPYGQRGRAWEQLESMLDPYSPGDQADDALALGYGDRGRLGEFDMPSDFDPECPCDGPSSLPMVFIHRRSSAPVSTGLVALLGMDQDDREMSDYDPSDLSSPDWGHHVYAPGAEEDPV